jgi:hypothetical protein
LLGLSPSLVRFQVFHGAGLPVPITTMFFFDVERSGLPGGSTTMVPCFDLAGRRAGIIRPGRAFLSPVGVLSLPFSRPMWPSTIGRAHISSPVSTSRANR